MRMETLSQGGVIYARFVPINSHSVQKQPYNVDEFLRARAKLGTYLMAKCQSEHYVKLSF